MALEAGIHQGVPWEQYEQIERANWSKLKLIAEAPAKYLHALTEQSEDTDARKMGRVVHLACFEPERFRSRIAVWRGGRRYGKEWDTFCKENAGRELLTVEEHERCLAIQAAVRNDAKAMRFVSRGVGESALLWQTESSDGTVIDAKGRLDFVSATAIVDLKTTRSANPRRFSRQAFSEDLRYDAQAAWYVDGYERATGKRLPFVFVAVETAPPYLVTVFRMPDRALELGREHYRALLDVLAHCRSTGHWPGYAEDVVDLEIPTWADPEADNDATGLGLVIGAE